MSDIPPIDGISDVQAEVKDLRIPDREKNPLPTETARPAGAPESYIYPTDPEYKALLGIYMENRGGPAQIQKGQRYFQVIKPDGYPVFVPLEVNLDQAYGSLSGRKI